MRNHIILIDDARTFVGKNNVPSLDDVLQCLTTINSNYQIEVKDDIIRAYVRR